LIATEPKQSQTTRTFEELKTSPGQKTISMEQVIIFRAVNRLNHAIFYSCAIAMR